MRANVVVILAIIIPTRNVSTTTVPAMHDCQTGHNKCLKKPPKTKHRFGLILAPETFGFRSELLGKVLIVYGRCSLEIDYNDKRLDRQRKVSYIYTDYMDPSTSMERATTRETMPT